MQNQIVPAVGPEVLIEDGHTATGLQAAQGPAGYPGQGSPANAAPAGEQAQAWRRLPQELRDRPQWLLAGANEKGELKVPLAIDYKGGTYLGSSTDPKCWMTYETAVGHAVRLGLGIGYVLSAVDPYCCVDLDIKDAEDYPNEPQKWTTQEQRDRHYSISVHMHSFTEYSRGGKGAHVWVRANIGEGCKRDFVEIYSQERFIACTGNVIADLPIADRQDMVTNMVALMRKDQGGLSVAVELDSVAAVEDDDAILEKAKSAANADKFNALMAGQWQALGYPSASEADAALIEVLCFYSPNDAQCRTLFRRSELAMRDGGKHLKDDRLLDLALKFVRGRMASDAENVRQLREQFKATPPGASLDTLAPPSMSLEVMQAELIFISDGEFVAFRSNPLVRGKAKEMRTLLLSNRTTLETQDAKGNTKEVEYKTFDLWLAGTRRDTVNTLTFDPSAGEVCPAPNGLRALNLYRPRLHVVPADWRARVEPFSRHLEHLVPDGIERQRFVQWLAHIQQRPGELPHYSFLMISELEGAGRGILFQILGEVWPGYVAQAMDMTKVLADNFTDELSHKLLVVVDEINEGVQNDMWKLAQKLKSFITAPVRHMNMKYGRRHTEKNCARLVVCSNHMTALPIGAADRRLNVIHNSNPPRDEAYYKMLGALKHDPSFIASVSEYLRTLPLDGFNPFARAEMNAAKAAVIENVRSEADERTLGMKDSWPRDIVTGAEFCREVYGPDYTQHDTGKLRYRAEAAGILRWKGNGKGLIRLGGRAGPQESVWILRNPERWAHADADAIRAALVQPLPT